jgi:hypothetical protein
VLVPGPGLLASLALGLVLGDSSSLGDRQEREEHGHRHDHEQRLVPAALVGEEGGAGGTTSGSEQQREAADRVGDHDPTSGRWLRSAWRLSNMAMARSCPRTTPVTWPTTMAVACTQAMVEGETAR